MARSSRVAGSLLTLRTQINVRYPNRDRRSDGLIGNLAHQSRSSDHNPWLTVAGIGVVRAFDCDVDGIPGDAYAEQLRQLGATGDKRLNPGGYVIFNGRIAGTHTRWQWRVYTGSNRHTGHVHVSVSTVPSGFDSLAPWPLPMLVDTTVKPQQQEEEFMDPKNERDLADFARDYLPGTDGVRGAGRMAMVLVRIEDHLRRTTEQLDKIATLLEQQSNRDGS